MSIGHPHLFFVKCLFKYFALFLSFNFLIVELESSLHILEPTLTQLANIFSRSVSCIFIFLMVSFADQELLILMRSNLSFPSFVILVISLYNPRSQKCSPIYSFKNCIDFYFIFRSVVHFVLSFV